MMIKMTNVPLYGCILSFPLSFGKAELACEVVISVLGKIRHRHTKGSSWHPNGLAGGP